jgi:hypothetical protein
LALWQAAKPLAKALKYAATLALPTLTKPCNKALYNGEIGKYVTIQIHISTIKRFNRIASNQCTVRPRMPNIRKVAASVAAAWDEPPATASRFKDDRYDWVDRPAVLYIGGKLRGLHEAPRIGDVLRLRAPANTAPEKITGVVLAARVRKDGIWTHAYLAFNGTVKWVSKATIAAHLGRMKGVTRVDQPTRVLNNRVHGGTHAWFVRVYDGKQPRVARTFSDGSAGGILPALKAALAFHSAHVDYDPDEGIPFP